LGRAADGSGPGARFSSFKLILFMKKNKLSGVGNRCRAVNTRKEGKGCKVRGVRLVRLVRLARKAICGCNL